MRNMKMWLAAACMGMLVGCSGAPSNTEIERAIERTASMATLGMADIDVSDLEVKNGRMKDKDTYVADVSFRYTMKMGGREEAHRESGHLIFSRGEDGWLVVGGL